MGPAQASQYNLQEPWARQPFDSDLSWRLFSDYLQQPIPRSLQVMAKRSHDPWSWAQYQQIAAQDFWVDRARAWDDHLDQIRRDTVEQVTQEDARARAVRHGALARKLQRMGESELDKLLSEASRLGSGMGLIQPRDAIRMITLGIQAERLALGEDVEAAPAKGPDLSGLTVEDLRQLRVLQQKAGT